ncbi:carbohydrate sulfotransferase 5-like [Bradysia coprophila]|uniref:carbohydrate sulfotransferase 5-like n=1 Tax=Bradysia coprophila TaxID=38358 RepID=UPI00187DBB5F|nr:carbohydrate sulfotransferase 5-like [Bradysia coprophila]
MRSKLLNNSSDIKCVRRPSRTTVIIFCILMIFLLTILIKSHSKTIYPVKKTVIIRKTENVSIKAIGVVNAMREEIALEMEDFEIDNEVIKLTNFTPETNGIPIRSVIISTWRSGSSFFGDILNSLPGSYYFYEPLRNLGDIQIRDGSSLVPKAEDDLHKLLKCNFSGMFQYMHSNFVRYNTRLHKFCGTILPFDMCTNDVTFMSNFCSIFPIQVIKEVRLRPGPAKAILMDSDLNVKIILLIRDPRGIVSSRKREKWCLFSKDRECGDYTNLCQDLTSDFEAAKHLTKEYPQQFKVVRYEDLSLNVFAVMEDVLNFYGLPFRTEVELFLKTHCTSNSGDTMSTYRDSKNVAFSWRYNLTFAEIEQLQSKCADAMNLWGYRRFNSEGELNDETIDPIAKSFDDIF